MIEPSLQKLFKESLLDATVNRQGQAWADIAARGFWDQCQRAFFDVRMFNPTA